MATFPTIEVRIWDGSAYTDVAADLIFLNIKRGRQRILDRHVTSTCTFVYETNNVFREPSYSGWLFGIGKFVFVQFDGTTAFAGRITDISVEYFSDEEVRVTMSCTSLFKNITNVPAPATTYIGTAAAAADYVIAQAIGGGASLGTWVLDRSVDGGPAVNTTGATGDTIEVVQEIAAGRNAEFYEEMWNDKSHPVYCYSGRDRRYKTYQATFTDASPSPPTSYPYVEDRSGPVSSASDDPVKNKVTVTSYVETATSTDATSQTDFGIRSYSVTTRSSTPGDAAADAAFLTDTYAQAASFRYSRIILEPDVQDNTDLWTLVKKLGYEAVVSPGLRFGDRIRVVNTSPLVGSFTRECVITGFEHIISPRNKDTWRAILYVEDAEASKDALILDDVTDGILDTNKLG